MTIDRPEAALERDASCRHLALSCQALAAGGGFERYARDLVGEFHRRGITPTVYARRFDRRLPEFGWVSPSEIAVGWAPSSWRDTLFAARLARRKAASLREYPHEYSGEYLIACNRPGIADLAVCGGTHIGFLRALGRRASLRDRVQIKLERATYADARHIIAHSEAMARELTELYDIAPEKICVLHPPVDDHRFRPAPSTERRKLREDLGLPGDRPVFGFVSTSHHRKGLAEVMTCFERHGEGVCLAVAGHRISSRAPQVVQLGYLHNIEQLFQACDWTIIASAYEPFGLVGIESILCGTPLIVAEGVGCAEVIASPAKIMYDPQAQGLAPAIDLARQSWHGGTSRIENPERALTYDWRVESHVDRLLELIGCRQWAPQATDLSTHESNPDR
jgi:glycosyltransferase involved in cell wall biosynthesis